MKPRNLLFVFLAVYFTIHLVQIIYPDGPTQYIFDEVFYVPASIQALHGVGVNAEHPPLPKLIGALGIWLLGNNWLGWRLPVVIMQVAAMYLFYRIGKRFLGEWWALGATVLLGLDTVWFIHGGALLIDMPMFLFGFLALELYFRGRHWWSAVAMGVAFFSREMALFVLGTVLVHHAYVSRGSLRPALKLGAKYTAIAAVVFVALLGAYDGAFHPIITSTTTNRVTPVVSEVNGTLTTSYSTQTVTNTTVISNPIEHLIFLLRYQGPLAAHLHEPYAPYQYAWNWVLPFDPVPYNGTFMSPQPFSAPTYFREDLTSHLANGTAVPTTAIFYRAQANLAVWYGFWPALAVSAYVVVKRKANAGTGAFVLAGMLLNYLPWVALSGVVRRIGFNYYFIYTLPFVTLGLAFAWRSLPPKLGRVVMAANLLIAAAFFVWFFPVVQF